MIDPKLPSGEQLVLWLSHHRHTQSSFSRLIGASQPQISSWIHGKSRPGPGDRESILRVTRISFPEQRRPTPVTPDRPSPGAPATKEAVECFRVLPTILAELVSIGRALQTLPGVMTDQVKTNHDIKAGLDLLVAHLALGAPATPQPKANGTRGHA